MKQMNQQLAIFRNFASLTVAALLAGCGTAPPVTQTVYVPVHTPCVTSRPARPVYEFDQLPLRQTATRFLHWRGIGFAGGGTRAN